MTEPIAISVVRLGEEEERNVLGTLRSGQLAQGPMVERLEAAFAELCGVEHAVAVSSGTTALVAALQALQVGPGDEVVTSPLTFVATLNAILECGATARFVDIDQHDFTMDAGQLEANLSDRTRVVMPVHLYGQPAAMDRIAPMAAAHGAVVVEDAAQAHGATIDGRAVGSFGVGCFSLYATKNVATGEGGVVTTDDGEVADRVRLLRNQGMRDRYAYQIPGHNYRLTDLQAAVGVPQLARLSELTARRRRNAERLSERLGGITGLVTPVTAPGRTHVFHQYTVRVTGEAPLTRDDLVEGLVARGIGTGVYYPAVVFDADCYRRDPRVVVEAAPEAEAAAGEVLSLPVHPWLSDDDLDRIVDGVRTLLRA
ncbi:MAG: DegT/DnrJ/EryC1/StrS family aminotransferase [Acidimicrobiia bacterium]